jgi:hypothetical protein
MKNIVSDGTRIGGNGKCIQNVDHKKLKDGRPLGLLRS